MLVLAVLTCPSTKGFAQGAPASTLADIARLADDLTPGKSVWAPQIVPAGPILVYVDLSRQRATVFRNGVRIGVTTISTGKPGYETPTGVFTILQKRVHHRSNRYKNAPMPFMQRLTWDGLALHAGDLPGHPASHGCVRMPLKFARDLFSVTAMGGAVVIDDRAGPSPEQRAVNAAPPTASDSAPEETFSWRPEVSPAGPVTIILSTTDQRVVVLRNGVEIGRSRLDASPDDAQTTKDLTLTHTADSMSKWIDAAAPDIAPEPLSVDRFHIPEAFYDALSAILNPGATLLVTHAPIDETIAGPLLTRVAPGL